MTDYKLMPKEPTQEQLDRVMGIVTGFSGDYGRFNDYLDERTAREVYETFWAYAPDVQEEPEETISAIISLVKDAAATHLNSEFNEYLCKIRNLLYTALHKRKGTS